jgi:SAM-dependent methyltransferase
MNLLKKLFYMKIGRELRGCKRILDLGCGRSSLLERLSGEYYSVGVDNYKPYLEESRQKGIHDEYVLSDIMKIDFPDRSFDAVISGQVIEHFTREDAVVLFKKMERWAKKKIILTTPNGFVPETEDDHPHEFMTHLSGWTVGDFAALGYRTWGYTGFKSLYGKKGFGKIAYFASFLVSYFLPRYAFQLLAIKDLSRLPVAELG